MLDQISFQKLVYTTCYFETIMLYCQVVNKQICQIFIKEVGEEVEEDLKNLEVEEVLRVKEKVDFISSFRTL